MRFKLEVYDAVLPELAVDVGLVVVGIEFAERLPVASDRARRYSSNICFHAAE